MIYSKDYYKVAIIGLGYVGLPFYLLTKKKNINVIGFDIDEVKIKLLKKKYLVDFYDPYIKEIKNKSKKIKGLISLKNINRYKVCQNYFDLDGVSKIILPGVGSFGDFMQRLNHGN